MAREPWGRDRVVAGIGLGLMVALLPAFLTSGLLAPPWAVVALLLVWVALVAVGVAWYRRYPRRVLALPFVAGAVWFVVMTVGEVLLGWTA